MKNLSREDPVILEPGDLGPSGRLPEISGYLLYHILDWVPSTKKNTKGLRHSGRKCPVCGKAANISPGPNKRGLRHQRAVHLVAQGLVAYTRGWIDKDGLQYLEKVAGEASAERNRFGPESLAFALFEVAGSKARNMKPLLPAENHVGLYVAHVIGPNREEVHFAVYDLGPDKLNRTQKRGTRRDVVNIPEAILDGLQKVIYPDDRMVSRMLVERVYVKGRGPGQRRKAGEKW